MVTEVRFNPARWPWPYELYIDGCYDSSYQSEEEALRAAERELRWRERMRWWQEQAASRPPLSEWSLDEIFDGYSPYAVHNYSTDELDAELARRFGIEVPQGQDVKNILLERGLIDRETWERITDFWDNGMV
jgi:hypothetical protein